MGNLTLNGASSGGITLQPAAVAGTNTITVPAITGTMSVQSAASFTQGSVIFAGASGVFSQNNSQFFWDNTNNALSIGSTIPVAKLYVEKTGGDVITARYNTSNARAGLYIGGTSGAPFFGYNLTFSSGNVFNYDTTGSMWAIGQPGGATGFAITVGTGTAGTSAGTDTAANVRLTIDTSGNVGIGTTSPGQKLHVYGASGYISLQIQSGTNLIQQFANSAANEQGFLTTGSNGISLLTNGGSNKFIMDSSGNVGIGTTSPGYKLDITSSAFYAYRVSPSVSTNGVSSFASNTGGTFSYGIDASTGANFGAAYGAFLWHSGAYPMLFGTNNTERMRINAGAPILCLSGGNTSATGTGIAFPATQSASSDVNTLDDYEEGTCNLAISDGTNSTAISVCTYTKIGRLVTVVCQLYAKTTTSFSTTAQLKITGLPFTITGNNMEIVLTSPNASNSTVMAEGPTSGVLVNLYKSNGTNNIDWATMTLTTLGAASGAQISIYGTFVYTTST